MANVVTAIGQWLKSAKGKIIAPKTLTKYVFDENGKSVEERFTLINTDAGNTIDVTLNKETYEMTVILKNKNGEELSSKTVDFPMELAFVNASYVEGQKKITFTLQSGAEVEVPLAKLIEGLVNTEDFNAAIGEIKTQIGKYTNYIDTDELNFSENGIDVSRSTNGKIFVLGTATADTKIQLVTNKRIKRIYANADHKLKLVGCPPGGSADTYYLYAERALGGDKFYDYGSGCEIPVTRNDNYYLYFCIKNGTTVGNIEEGEELEIHPMITNNMNCTYDDYCPYIGGSSVINTLRSMYIKINNILKRADNTDTNIKALSNAIEYSYKSIGRYNNLLVSNGKSFVKLYDDNDDSTKITITYNGDGTYTLNGTTGNSNDTGKYISVDLTDSFVLKKGTYYLTGLPRDGVINPNDRIYLGGWQKDIKISIYTTGEFKLTLEIGSNVTFDNAILKPMLVIYDENNIPTYDDFVVGIAPNTSLYMNVNELKKDIIDMKNDVSSLHVSVNNEIAELNSNLSDLAYGDNGGYNIFKDTTWIVGKHITENGINDYDETGSAYSDYISIVEPNTYYISSLTHPKFTVFEYDTNKSFIKYNGWKKDNNTPCVLSGNCAYIIISFSSASSNIQPSNVMLAKTPNLPYIPYIPSVKMLAEENAQQSNSIVDMKMLGWIVPSECPVQNYVDSDGVFHQRVGRLNISNIITEYLDWGSGKSFYGEIPNSAVYASNEIANATMQGYKVVVANDSYNHTLNKSFSIHKNPPAIYINDSTYTDVSTFVTALRNTYLYYEIVTENIIYPGAEQITQIDDSLSVIGKCKNLISTTLSTTTASGVTCTSNGDGTYTLSGTNSSSSSNVTFILNLNYYDFPTSAVKLVGCPALSESGKVILQTCYNGTWGTSSLWDTGKGVILENGQKLTKIAILVYPGKNVDGIVIKPMLSTNLNSTYNDYVPYTGNSDTIIGDINKIEKDLDIARYGEFSGSKNLFDERFILIVLTAGTNLTNRNLYKENFDIMKRPNGTSKYYTFGGYFKAGTYTLSYDNSVYITLNRVAIAGTNCVNVDKHIRYSYTWTQTVDGYTYFTIEHESSDTDYTDIVFTEFPNIMIEEGTKNTGYKKYVSSNAQLTSDIEPIKNIIGPYKNLLNINNYPLLNETKVINGVTCTINIDGTYTVNGTATDNVYFLVENTKEIAKRYVNKPLYLTGCPANGGGGQYDLRYEINNTAGNGGCNLYDESYKIAYNNVLSADKITSSAIWIAVKKGVTVKNLVFKPMLTEYPTDGYNSFLPPIGNNSNIQNDILNIKQLQFSKLIEDNTPITINLQGIYLISYWQGADQSVVGCGILSSSNYKESSKYTPLVSESSITVTPNGDSTVTIKRNINAAITMYFTKLSV